MTKELFKAIYGVGGQKARHRCPFCFRNFETRKQYDAHWSEVHGEGGPERYPVLNPSDGVVRPEAVREAKARDLQAL